MSVVSETHTSQDGRSVLSVDDLSIEYQTDDEAVEVVHNVSLHIESDETLGIAGGSGNDKSTLALAIPWYLGRDGRITSGAIEYDGQPVLDLSSWELGEFRGSGIAHVPQGPNTALNPGMTVDDQISEVVRTHRDVSRLEAVEQTYGVLHEVNLPNPKTNVSQYPHELFGGQQQHVLLAIALACQPKLLILDEPTIGLDITTQAKILDLIDDLIEERSTSVLLIAHNLDVINQVADRIGIIYAGEIIEVGATDEVSRSPTNPYTQGLLMSLLQGEDRRLKPIPGQIGDLRTIPDGCVLTDRYGFTTDECREGSVEKVSVDGNPSHMTRCRRWKHAVMNPIQADTQTLEHGEGSERPTLIKAQSVTKYFGESSFPDRVFDGEPPVEAADGMGLHVHEAKILGVVDEPDCGKGTLGSVLLSLLPSTDRKISLQKTTFDEMEDSDWKEFRSERQVVLQNPHSSLNPKHTIGEAIKRPLELFTSQSEDKQCERVAELLAQVGSQPSYANCYPRDLSGGEKQRVAITRAFSVNPSFVVSDEPVSTLDISVRTSILDLLTELQREYGTSYLFTNHDFSIISYISDQIAVMYLGNFVEVGSTESIFDPPFHPYTCALLSDIPSAGPGMGRKRIYLESDVPSTRDLPSDCPFQTRCPQKIGDVCERSVPTFEAVNPDDPNHLVPCHLDSEEMMPTEDLL